MNTTSRKHGSRLVFAFFVCVLGACGSAPTAAIDSDGSASALASVTTTSDPLAHVRLRDRETKRVLALSSVSPELRRVVTKAASDVRAAKKSAADVWVECWGWASGGEAGAQCIVGGYYCFVNLSLDEGVEADCGNCDDHGGCD